MTKKDEKDADRPHYYSQFWLDVAAGRRVIGTPKSDDGLDDSEADLPEPTPITHKSGRSATLPVDGYRETRQTAVAEPDFADDELNEPEEEEEADEEDTLDLISDLDDEDIPNILVDDTADDEPTEADEPELVLAEDTEAEDEEEPGADGEFFDEEEEEEEDEEEWTARGRKKPKPGRQVKTPKPVVKKPKRGRGF